jgi:tetratricopeptide (TPR) repeat protein
MRASVLNDAALVKRAGQFAWLSIDSDKPVNAAISEKLAAEGVPVFSVIDSSTGKIALSWYGSATAAQLVALADDGARVISGGASGPDAVLARADQANARKDYKDAAAFYEQALKAGGDRWSKRQRVLESLIMAQMFAHDNAACAETALRDAPGMARDRSFDNVVYFGLGCAKSGTPEMKSLLKLGEEAVHIPGVLSDDTSQLYGELVWHYRDEKDEAAAARAAGAWLAYLRKELAEAKTSEARLALDLQLVSAATALRKPEVALPEIERAERELPGEYMPPRSAASLYAQMGRWDDAMNACGRALARADGEPKLRVYTMCGGLLVRKGDKPAAKKMYEEGLAYGKTLPEGVGKNAIRALQNAAAKL